MLDQYKESLSGGWGHSATTDIYPVSKIISEISIDILQILASCLLLHYTVFLKIEEVLLKMQSSVSKGEVWVAMCALCFSFWNVSNHVRASVSGQEDGMLNYFTVFNLIFKNIIRNPILITNVIFNDSNREPPSIFKTQDWNWSSHF